MIGTHNYASYAPDAMAIFLNESRIKKPLKYVYGCVLTFFYEQDVAHKYVYIGHVHAFLIIATSLVKAMKPATIFIL